MMAMAVPMRFGTLVPWLADEPSKLDEQDGGLPVT